MVTNYSNEDLIVMFSYFSANPNKITMILISVGVSIGSVGLPLLTENYVKGDLQSASRLIQDSITMLFPILISCNSWSGDGRRAPLYSFFMVSQIV